MNTATADPRNTDDDIARLRVPPHSQEAEQSLLGGLMQDNCAFDRVADLVDEADFYRFENRTIFRAIANLINAGKPADVITVFERLQATGKDDGDIPTCLPYLNALAQSVPSAANTRRYAEIVRERAILRHLIAATDEIAAAAFHPQGRTVLEVLGQAEAKVLAIGRHGARRGGYRMLGDLLPALIDRVSDLHDRGGGDVVGIPTGFRDVDRLTAGLQPGDLIVIAGRPSMGKTALALNIAEHVALKAGLPVVVFSMEMGASQLALRMTGSSGRLNQHLLRTGQLQGDQWGRLAEAVDRLTPAPICIDESAALTVAEISARARRIARERGQLGLVVIDYLQLMSGTSGSEENRATQLGEISRGLKAMAKELHCPVIAISQLNRSVESRNDKRPLMSDLRDSGAIEQDADVIAFVYRDEYYTKEHCKEPGVAEIIVAKQRSGPVGTVKLAWNGPLTRFLDLAHDYAARRQPVSNEAGFE